MRESDARSRWGGLVAAFLAVSAAVAQTIPQSPDSPNDYPTALPPRKGPAPPALLFKLLAEVPLPATPIGRDLSFDGRKIVVPLEGGTAEVGLSEPLAATLPDPPASPAQRLPEWVVSEDGRFRVRTHPSGQVEAEKMGSFSHKWKRAWKLKTPGATLAPALLLGQRVVFGSVDNQVYCVRRKNGHRVWAADLEDRISNALALWRGEVALAPAGGRSVLAPVVEAILAVPDGGASLFALDVYDGSRLATYELPSGMGMLVTGPLVLPDGRVAVARTSYASDRAALLLLRPGIAAEPPQTGPK